MFLQCAALDKALATGPTHERAFACVLLQVELEVLGLSIALLAVRALVRFEATVSEHVALQLIGAGEIFAANCAMEWLFAGVHSTMRC